MAQVFTTSDSGDQNICELPKVVGDCRAALPRYFYNKDTKECEFFLYGGCGGNENNFATKDECEEKCKNQVKY